MAILRDAHEWRAGAVIVRNALAICEACGCLRSTSGDRGTIFIRRRRDEDGRVTDTEPPCLIDAAPFRAPW